MKTASQPLVSIVTPVHNEAEYLAQCIESVLAQTYQNWEYTIVDNCSTDGSDEIARRYAATDRRIRIHKNQQFLLALPNFNHALRQISPTSKFCKVVLGDDWIFPECLERMVAAAEEHPSVGIVSAYSLEGSQIKWMGLPYSTRPISGREICRMHFLEAVHVFGTPTTVLYRADLVRSHDPFYNEANIHSDTQTCFALLKTSDFAFVHQVLTFSRVRPASRATVSSDLNTHVGGLLKTLLRHGPDYLSPDEFETELDRLLSEYYRYLGTSLLIGRDKRFWDYHYKQLTEAGVGFSRTRLAGAALARLCKAVLSPYETIEKLRERRRLTPAKAANSDVARSGSPADANRLGPDLPVSAPPEC
jgi:glycosyltransferase involved in cell wall biosynthesis